MTEQDLDWQAVMAADELEDEEPEHVRVGEALVCLVKLGEEIHAIDDVCTHEFALLSEGFCEDGEVECPLHQARFDVRTGKCTAGPAETDVPTYRVEVRDGQVYVGVPRSR